MQPTAFWVITCTFRPTDAQSSVAMITMSFNKLSSQGPYTVLMYTCAQAFAHVHSTCTCTHIRTITHLFGIIRSCIFSVTTSTSHCFSFTLGWCHFSCSAADSLIALLFFSEAVWAHRNVLYRHIRPTLCPLLQFL